jgi:hypothetical protein
MGKVRTGLAVSLDGFISGPDDGAAAPMGAGRAVCPALGTRGTVDTVACRERTRGKR